MQPVHCSDPGASPRTSATASYHPVWGPRGVFLVEFFEFRFSNNSLKIRRSQVTCPFRTPAWDLGPCTSALPEPGIPTTLTPVAEQGSLPPLTALQHPLRCPTMSGWNSSLNGRKVPTSRTKCGKQWRSSWPSDLSQYMAGPPRPAWAPGRQEVALDRPWRQEAGAARLFR